MGKEIYLDNSATTMLLPDVGKEMTRIGIEEYGNPSSLHHMGIVAEKYFKEASETVAETLKVSPKEIIWTSGGTESDNLALRGIAEGYKRQGNHIITSAIEHPAVLKTCAYLENQGFEVSYIPVDKKGILRVDMLEEALRQETILVSIMHTNNEIGSLQPLAAISSVIKKKAPNALFHTDAVQGYGKADIFPKKMGIDLLSVSAHKFHGPKGVGFLYAREGLKLRPILFGGGQQRNLRS
ncbi:MAG: cysteine desulfurase, partial [Lachnospiraceae bacterium]|nr:cysteine desulfurase [Lachnospiraceae bacterium]